MRIARLAMVPMAVAGLVGVVIGMGGRVAVADADVPASLVEDYAYPGADQILAEHGLTIYRGDGNIEFVPPEDGVCPSGLVRVETTLDVEPYLGLYCFRTTGSRGFVTLEIPDTFRVRAAAEALEATAYIVDEEAPEAEPDVEVYDVRPNRSVAIGEGDANAAGPAILVELRFGEW